MKRFFALALAVAAAALGCQHTTEHSLPSLSGALVQRACSIGVARVSDAEGINFAIDLRDYLRAHGPCTDVRVVGDAETDQADLVVSARLGGSRTLGSTPEMRRATLAFIAGGLTGGLAVTFFIVSAVLTPNPPYSTAADIHSAQQTINAVGAVVGAIALATLGAGVYAVVDNGGAVEMRGEPLQADVEITRGGDTVARLDLRDTVAARANSPSRTPVHARGDEYAPLQRDLLDRVFEHIAAKLDELVSTTPPRPAQGMVDRPSAP